MWCKQHGSRIKIFFRFFWIPLCIVHCTPYASEFLLFFCPIRTPPTHFCIHFKTIEAIFVFVCFFGNCWIYILLDELLNFYYRKEKSVDRLSSILLFYLTNLIYSILRVQLPSVDMEIEHGKNRKMDEEKFCIPSVHHIPMTFCVVVYCVLFQSNNMNTVHNKNSMNKSRYIAILCGICLFSVNNMLGLFALAAVPVWRNSFFWIVSFRFDWTDSEYSLENTNYYYSLQFFTSISRKFFSL